MALKFLIDRMINDIPYPNLARLKVQPGGYDWQKFSRTWPYSEPVHFFDYLRLHNIPFEFVSAEQSDTNTLYPVSISYFDFGVDWFELMPAPVRNLLHAEQLKVWFLYSEGDNPSRIQKHLQLLAAQHNINFNLIHFTSANTQADNLSNFSFWPDDESLFQLRNKDEPIKFHDNPRTKKFTALVRTHKLWRASTMARFWRRGLHTQGYFSYNNYISVPEEDYENPIAVDAFKLRSSTNLFIARCPFTADNLSSDEHNLYGTTVSEHFSNSYLNLVLETHLDVDQSAGVFLTEKTFKPIKNAQPFIIIGAQNSLQLLRNLGYRTFDHVIDTSYDSIANHTQRWDAACCEFERLITKADLHSVYLQCRDDIEHNQKLFLSSKKDRVNTLIEKVTHATIS